MKRELPSGSSLRAQRSKLLNFRSDRKRAASSLLARRLSILFANSVRNAGVCFAALAMTVLLLAATSSQAQDSTFTLLRTIRVEATDIAVDGLDNLYLVTPTGLLKKYGPAGDSIAVFNNVRRFGKLHGIDVSNPLRPLLFYKDFSTIVLLDRLLSQKAVLDLRRARIAQASAAATSFDNNIWIFDAVESKLRKLDESGRMLMETPDFRQLFNFSFVPTRILDVDRAVYLFDPQVGVLVFDYYGTFQRRFPVESWSLLAVFDRQLLGVQGNSLVLLNTGTLLQRQYQFPSSFGGFNRYLVGNNKLFAMGKDSISVFRVGF
ncbi:MAG: hypothetical protein EOO08_03230 [Chitinophagaceae bacterium]|nr:MAG: hypothetical protein EOO08_03230 [Chitinophagaceae bacterium]